MTSSNIIQLNNSIWESGSAAEKRTFLPVETRLVSNQRTSRCDNEAEKREQIRSDRIGSDWTLHCLRRSCFHIMSVFAWLLWALFRVIVAGPFERATWSDGETSLLMEEDAARLRPRFLQLPMFHHAPAPLVARELFRPVHQKRPLPAGLTSLLLPPRTRPQSVQETAARAVDVWCGVDQVSVSVSRVQLRTWTDPSLFRLGSCQASRITPHHVHFNYGLRECGGHAKVCALTQSNFCCT